MAVPDAVYTDKNHTKINREYTTIKLWLRGLLSHAPMHTKISDEYIAKKTLVED